MNKILPIVVSGIVFVVLLCSCASSSTYIDRLESVVPSFYEAEDLVADCVVKDEANTDYLNYVKTQISQFKDIDEFASLNWDAFDKVNTVYTMETEMDNIPELGLDTDAVYLQKMGGIIFYPAVATYPKEQQFQVAAHELCHALLEPKDGSSQKQNAFIVEGETELLALSFTISLGMQPEPAYLNGVFAALWLNDLFGAKIVRSAIIANNLDEMINKNLGDNEACSKINIGGYMAECGVESEIGGNAEIELLCYLSKALDKASIGEKWVQEISRSFEWVDVKFFNKILSS